MNVCKVRKIARSWTVCTSASCALAARPAAVLLVEPGQVLGPAASLQAYRFLADSRDTETENRLRFGRSVQRVPLPRYHELR